MGSAHEILGLLKALRGWRVAVTPAEARSARRVEPTMQEVRAAYLMHGKLPSSGHKSIDHGERRYKLHPASPRETTPAQSQSSVGAPCPREPPTSADERDFICRATPRKAPMLPTKRRELSGDFQIMLTKFNKPDGRL